MSTTISQAFVKQFGDNINLLSQQMLSRTRGCVTEKMVRGDSATFERLGSETLVEKVSRHTDTPIGDIAHSRRTVSLRTFHQAELLDNEDQIKMLIDPRSDYARSLVAAANRKIDDLVLDAAIGTAYSGVSGGTGVTLPAGQLIAAGGTGLTTVKLREARTLLAQANVDLDNDELYLIVNGEGMEDLYTIAEFINRDYNMGSREVDLAKVMPAGYLGSFLGFNIIHCERITSLAGTYGGTLIATTARPCIAFTRSAIGLAIGEDIKTQISLRDDKNYAAQVYLEMTMGATRIHDDRVVDIRIAE